MTEEEKVRTARQHSALDVYKPQGALIQTEYLNRTQQVVGVNKTDLDDILSFDGVAALFSQGGMFLLSGAGWLGVDKLLDQTKFEITPAIGVCAGLAVVGLIFILTGLFFHHKKRGRIDRILSEVK